jgi:hypothetical protein
VFGIGEEIQVVANHKVHPALGTINVTAAELDQARAIADRVLQSFPGATTGYVQQKLVWQSPLGHQCSTIPDHVDPVTMVDTDLKTAWTLDEHELRRQISEYGYDIAAAAGLDGVRAVYGMAGSAFRWLFVASTKPFDVVSMPISDAQLASGIAKWEQANLLWAKCLADNDWPDLEQYGPKERKRPVTEWLLD